MSRQRNPLLPTFCTTFTFASPRRRNRQMSSESSSTSTQSNSPRNLSPDPSTQRQTSNKFPWSDLPTDLRHKILYQIPLPQLFNKQHLFPYDAPQTLDDRIRALQPLWRAWIDSPMDVRNTKDHRTRRDRLECTPTRFVQLERLVLGSSSFNGTLPSAIAEFRHNLKVLHIDDNRLTSLPKEIQLCTKLLLLDCSQNDFDTVPQYVLKLPNVRYLNFASNPRLSKLPPDLANTPQLVALSFSHCSLTSLPSELIYRVAECKDFTLNVACNNFPRHYLKNIFESYPSFRKRMIHG